MAISSPDTPGSEAEIGLLESRNPTVEIPETPAELATRLQNNINVKTKNLTEEILVAMDKSIEVIGQDSEIDRRPEFVNLRSELTAVSVAAETLSKKMAREITSAVAGEEPEQSPESEKMAGLHHDEIAYLSDPGHHQGKGWEGLEARYADERTEAPYVQAQVESFAAASGLAHESITELAGQSFNSDTRHVVEQSATRHVERLLNDRERGRVNPEKQKSVAAEVSRYLDLVIQAQAEGDIPPDLQAEDLLKLVEENVWALAWQDRVASENTLGDHGIRHLVDHNITTMERMFSLLEERGQPVKAIDRILGHQVMILHDLGYAMDPVRERVNAPDFKQEDAGHNVLAAKIIRQRGADRNDVLARIFTADQLADIHRGILDHDDTSVRFNTTDRSPDARRANLNSAIHLADNTHAFADKLPEILYAVPESIEVMRLLQAAGESGDASTMESCKERLIDVIQRQESFSADDKAALKQATSRLSPESYKFTVGRICGRKPELSMDQSGKVEIKVQESAIHRQAVGLFQMESYEQLRKFIGDLTKQKKGDVRLDTDTIDTETLKIVLELGDRGSTEMNDFETRLRELVLNRPEFNAWNVADKLLATRIAEIQQLLRSGDTLEPFVEGGRATGNTTTAKDILGLTLQKNQALRNSGLREYLQKSNKS